jgi:type I restriction enzyme, S subunit
VSVATEPVATEAPVVPLTEAVELNPRPERGALSDDLEVSFVPMAAVEAATGRMDASAVRPFGEVKNGYTVFREGDVLFAKITPCMENGKMVVARGLRNGVGCGSTEFHVLRPRPGVDPHYVYHFVSSARFRAEAAHHMAGAVGQKRVPAAFLEQSEIRLPKLDEQRRIVAEIEKQFSRLDEAVANLKRVKANLKRYKAAVLKAAVEGRLVPTEAELARREGKLGDVVTSSWRKLIAAFPSCVRWRPKSLPTSIAPTACVALPWVPCFFPIEGLWQSGRMH